MCVVCCVVRARLTLDEQKAEAAEEKSIQQRVTDKLNSQLIARPEMDRCFDRLLSEPQRVAIPLIGLKFDRMWLNRLITKQRFATDTASYNQYRQMIAAAAHLLVCCDPAYTVGWTAYVNATIDLSFDANHLRMYQRFVRLQPNDRNGWFAVAVALTVSPKQANQKDRNRIADAVLRKQLNIYKPEPPPPQAWCSLALICRKMGSYKECLQVAKRGLESVTEALKTSPFDARLQTARSHLELTQAEAYVAMGQQQTMAKGVALFTEILSRSASLAAAAAASPSSAGGSGSGSGSGDATSLRALQGLCEYALSLPEPDYGLVENYCQCILQLSPRSDWAMCLIGWQRFHRDPTNPQSATEAIPLMERAIEWNPLSSEHVLKLGRMYWTMGGQYRSGKQFAYAKFLKAAQLVRGAARSARSLSVACRCH